MKRTAFFAAVLALAAAGCAHTPPTAAPAAVPPPLAFSLDTIDKSADPCVDFYQYACGTWIKNTEIPPDRGMWVSFIELDERNLDIERGILDAARAGGAGRDPIDQKIGDLYGACMDVAAVDARGVAPLEPELARIAALPDKAALAAELARLHLAGGGALFSFYSDADMHDAGRVIAYLDQGGLSLPDRDYYLKDSPRMKEMRARLFEYVYRVFTLAGRPPTKAARAAADVLRIETALAHASMDRTVRRNPKSRDHKMSRADAIALAPGLGLDRYFAAAGTPGFSELNVSNPAFFRALEGLLDAESLDSLKTYLSWHLLRDASPWLSQPFVAAQFRMRQALSGQKEIEPRWKRCIGLVNAKLGEALGQRYVEVAFGESSKRRVLAMVGHLEQALDTDIGELSWMSPATKRQARAKLEAIGNKIGYPDVWRDYSSVVIRPDDLLGDVRRASEFESRRQLAKIGKPVDRKEWWMTPPTVNAYYSQSVNEIVFPAGILQPPFFDPRMDEAVNYGGIGVVIGHELTHGFDDQGRKFDAKGNLRDWWTAADAKAFAQRASCIADEYSKFVAVDDLKLNGRLTLGENTADNGGARIALMALERALAADKSGAARRKIGGYTPEQRFFLGTARVWCEKRRPELARARVLTDQHSPGRYRINGVVRNMPEFARAWGCKAGQPMVAADACRVW